MVSAQKVALTILSAASPAELRRAIALEDSGRFQLIPGIGKKTAQRIVLELREKLAAGAPAGAPAAGVSSQHLVAREALVGLGYSLLEAERALAPVDPELPAEERIKQALKAQPDCQLPGPLEGRVGLPTPVAATSLLPRRL